MKALALELGDIFRLHGPAYLTRFGDSLSHEQKKALRAIAVCRTAALGGHVDQCDQCGYRKISYCSCRNRNCPKCHGQARARWLEQCAAELLPVEYLHVVFTLPQLSAPLALRNQRLVYGLLFRAAAETLLQIAADPRHLGARIGFLAVLHTWGQKLHHHPHLHCLIHTSTASFPAAESHANSTTGFRVGGSSCFRSRCSAVSSGANSSHI
jgi:hypothetical protein